MPGAWLGLAALLSMSLSGHAPALAQAERGVSDLIAALQSADPAARARAACELRDLGDRAAPAIGALAALLDDPSPVEGSACGRRWWRLTEDTSPGEIAAAALVAIGSRAYAVLEDAAKAPAWVARRNAARGLGALDDNRAIPTLISTLRDREPPVREQAAWALGALDARDAVEPLLAALDDDAAVVRRQAAWALGAIGGEKAGAGLAARLRDSDDGVRTQAAWALGAVGHRGSVEPLLQALVDPAASVRRQAAWALGAIGDRKAVSGLAAALEDRDAGVRRQAAWAIGAIGR